MLSFLEVDIEYIRTCYRWQLCVKLGLIHRLLALENLILPHCTKLVIITKHQTINSLNHNLIFRCSWEPGTCSNLVQIFGELFIIRMYSSLVCHCRWTSIRRQSMVPRLLGVQLFWDMQRSLCTYVYQFKNCSLFYQL